MESLQNSSIVVPKSALMKIVSCVMVLTEESSVRDDWVRQGNVSGVMNLREFESALALVVYQYSWTCAR
jgi:hypothetical protein